MEGHIFRKKNYKNADEMYSCTFEIPGEAVGGFFSNQPLILDWLAVS